MAAIDIFKADASGELKEYQTLFWVPMLFQTAKQAESLIDEMLDMIQVISFSSKSYERSHSLKFECSSGFS